jgi:iron complex outermembrane recepter protein
MKKHTLYKSVLLATSALGAGLAMPAVAQQGNTLQLEEIVVTARRREERLQDVPISMTVFTQESMNNANITNASDIANYTPSLYANNRFGADTSSFAIRGFSQEIRTTASVGVYFAEVVAPRGANTTQSGDGAGPGDFFDLENVQVLKGPQGTLFGRNTTGGAILLSPKKPTDELEGYVEASAGNFDMWRGQGVINVPVSDVLRFRLGVDSQQRDGYLNNITGIGPDDFSDVGYTSFRGSVVWDITDTLENYTILKYTDSSNNGSPYAILDCNTAPTASLGSFCAGDLNARRASGNDGFYDVASILPDSYSDSETQQIINTTTWEVSDNLTVKNIASFAALETAMHMQLYGTNWTAPIFNNLGQPVGTQPIVFQMVGTANGEATTDQETFVEELQFQGTAMDDRLTWQAGLYYEKSEPGGDYGAQSPSTISCDLNTVTSPNPADWRCNNLLVALGSFGAGRGFTVPAMARGGTMAKSPGGVTYENQAVYVQTTYDFTDQLSGTLGLRYTKDDTEGEQNETVYAFPGDVRGGYFAPVVASTAYINPKASSDEPTWVLGLDYKPTDDMLLYAKYARGYRQGSVNIASVPSLAVHEPESVDTYELGSKITINGPIPGTINAAVFYNDFTDQQLQAGYLKTTGVGSTSIVNAGASTIMGLELEGNFQLTDSFTLSASYAYLDTEVDELEFPFDYTNPLELAALGIGQWSGSSAAVGEPLSYSPENKLVLVGTYLLPLDESLGEMIASVTYSYNDEMQGVSQATSKYATIDDYSLLNLNLNWNGIAGSPVDMSLFATNVTDEEYLNYLTGNWNSGLEAVRTGVPRMYGARVKYNF